MYYVQSFPHLRLSASDQLIEDLELQPTTKLDFWRGEWITVSLDTVLTVEKGQRVLLKIRPSLRKTLGDCPGIEEELEMQPKYRSVGIKRPAEELVSPARKSQRCDTAKSTHISAHKPLSVMSSEPEVIPPIPPKLPTHHIHQRRPQLKLPKQKYTQDRSLKCVPWAQNQPPLQNQIPNQSVGHMNSKYIAFIMVSSKYVRL